MAKKTPKLSNPTVLGLHLVPGLEDEYITEAQYILDDTQTEKQGKNVSIQETIDSIQEKQENIADEDDIDSVMTTCVPNEENEDEILK